MTTPKQLASVTDFLSWGSDQELVQNKTHWTARSLTTLMTRASLAVQSKCHRRLLPFTTLLETSTAMGMSPEEYGEQGDMAMDLTGALGWSQAASLGVSDMVREFWLQEYAPAYPEMWTTTLNRVEFLRTFGDTQTFQATAFTTWQGPEPDTGHIKMPIGTYCPQGTTIRVWYSGGYTPVPADLNLACILQAVKFVLIGAEPEIQDRLSSADLDDELLLMLTPYVR